VSAATITVERPGSAVDETRARLAELEARHARRRHFWRWTGRTQAGHRVLGCMLCAARMSER